MTEGRAPPTIEFSGLSAAAKVLLVDDDVAILNGISEFLESEGFSVVSAGNGIEALNKLRSGLRFDVIVLDVLMPLMDGWDFRAEQLADPSLRATPVIVITASGFSKNTLLHQFSAFEVLAKPLDLGGFARTLKDACGGRDGGPPASPASTH